MYRNIELNYKLNEEKTILTIEMVEETKEKYRGYSREYDLIKYDDEMLLRSQVIEDFEAQHDDLLASLLDKLINKMLEENEF